MELNWRLVGILVSFVLYHTSSAAPAATGNPCLNEAFFNKECHINETGLLTFEKFRELPVETQLNIADACSTIKFLCTAEMARSNGAKPGAESEDVCNDLAVLNNQPLDCTNVDKVKECAVAKNFTQKLKDPNFCKSVCTTEEGQTKVCSNLLLVQRIAARNASSEKEPSAEKAPQDDSKHGEGEAAAKVDLKAQSDKKSSSVKKEAEVKPAENPPPEEVVEKGNAAEKDDKNGEKDNEPEAKSPKTEDLPKMDQDPEKQNEPVEKSKPNEEVKITTVDSSSSTLKQDAKDQDDVKKTTSVSDGIGQKNADAVDEKQENGENVADDASKNKNEAQENVDPSQNGKEQESLIDDKEETKKSPDHIDVDVSDVKAKPQIVDPFRNTMNESEENYSHVLSYFFALTIICIAGYLIFHNKQKLIALILEGRRRPSGRRGARRPSSAQYRKLDNNLEEAGGPNSSATFSQAVY